MYVTTSDVFFCAVRPTCKAYKIVDLAVFSVCEALGIFAVASCACESGLCKNFCFCCIESNTVIISLLPVVKVNRTQGNAIPPLPISS